MFTRDQILGALGAFAEQRPGLDPRNYISSGRDSEGRRAYFGEARAITRDLHDARTLLAAVRWRQGIGAAELAKAFGAFSGRLTLTDRGLDYCTGQYWPTEYRKAVCAVLASALWAYWRDEGAKTADDIRRKARREFGRGIASRWFN